MIISGGENIHPVEVEAVLTEHPAVAEAAVIGASDERWGQRVVAFVVADVGRTRTSSTATAVSLSRSPPSNGRASTASSTNYPRARQGSCCAES